MGQFSSVFLTTGFLSPCFLLPEHTPFLSQPFALTHLNKNIPSLTLLHCPLLWAQCLEWGLVHDNAFKVSRVSGMVVISTSEMPLS